MWKFVLVKFKKKSMFLKTLTWTKLHVRIHFDRKYISYSRICDIKTTNAKSVTNTSMCVMFISKNSNPHEIEHTVCLTLLLSFPEPCRVCLVVSVSASHTVGRGLSYRSGHTKDHHENGTNCLPVWHAMR